MITDGAPTSGSRRRNDHEAARELAAGAGRLLVDIRSGLAEGVAADVLRRQGDQGSHDFIASRLERYFANDAVLSEEAPRPRSPNADRLWVIDPLDGTREFGEPGRQDWAVHVALIDGDRLAAGAVALPARSVTYSTQPPPRLAPRERRRVRIAVSRTRPPVEAQMLERLLGAELVPMGSAGAKAAAVVSGFVDAYVHSGGQHVWDSAAPVAVAVAAGLHASRVDGSALVYGLKETWLPDLVICRPEIAERVLTALRGS